MANFDYRKFLKENKSTFHSSLNEGQFSWFTQDTEEQIGSERENTLPFVYMHDDKGNKWLEKDYEGYGEFGGKDYYELLDQMNGGSGDRSEGIKLAFNDELVNARKVLFPALTVSPTLDRFHDFSFEAKHDPDQSWYNHKDDDDDDDSWETQYDEDGDETLQEAYTPGSGWTEDFDYDDMLAQGLKLNADSSLEDLEKVVADFEDVNYHREAEPLFYAIDAIKAGDRGEAKMYINKFHKELKKTIADYSNEYFDVNEAQEGRLDVASIAQQVADEFTKSDNLDLKYVITPGSIEDTPAGPRRGAGFDLDVEAGPNTPGEDWKDEKGFGIDNYLGHFAGGSFTITPEGDGYVVRNAAMKNAVVGYVTPEGELDFVRDQEKHYDDIMSAEEKANVFVREAEGEVMVDAKLLASYIDAMIEYADEEYTPNILKSLKDLKSKLSGEMSVKDALDFVQKTIDITGDDIDAIEALGQATDYDDAVIAQARKIMGIDENKKSNKMKKSELKEMIKAAMLAEYEKDVNVTDENPENEEDFLAEIEAILAEADEEVDAEATAEETDTTDAESDTETADVTVDDTETIDTETTTEVDPNVKATQDALTQAIEAAKKLGDKKLEAQIGNTITFFTRSHVVGDGAGAEGAVAENTKEYYKDAEADDAEHINDLEKDMADDKEVSMKIGEVMFPMWTNLKK